MPKMYSVWFPDHDNPDKTEIVPITHIGQVIDACGKWGWIMQDGNVLLHQGVVDEIITIDGFNGGLSYTTKMAPDISSYLAEPQRRP